MSSYPADLRSSCGWCIQPSSVHNFWPFVPISACQSRCGWHYPKWFARTPNGSVHNHHSSTWIIDPTNSKLMYFNRFLTKNSLWRKCCVFQSKLNMKLFRLFCVNIGCAHVFWLQPLYRSYWQRSLRQSFPTQKLKYPRISFWGSVKCCQTKWQLFSS